MQIAVIGSAGDHGFSEAAEKFARELGREIAARGHALFYGPELKMASLSQIAARSARDSGGRTIGVAIGCARTGFYDRQAAEHVIYTDCSGGAGREVVLANSADVVIAIGGGSGTLTELSIAYMNCIPVVAFRGSGGWSDKLIGEFLDQRQKFRIAGADSALEAVSLAEKMHAALQDRPSLFDRTPG